MAKFPASPGYTGFHAPSRLEVDPRSAPAVPRLEARPLATARLGMRLRGGLHGNRIPAHQL